MLPPPARNVCSIASNVKETYFVNVLKTKWRPYKNVTSSPTHNACRNALNFIRNLRCK